MIQDVLPTELVQYILSLFLAADWASREASRQEAFRLRLVSSESHPSLYTHKTTLTRREGQLEEIVRPVVFGKFPLEQLTYNDLRNRAISKAWVSRLLADKFKRYVKGQDNRTRYLDRIWRTAWLIASQRAKNGSPIDLFDVCAALTAGGRTDLVLRSLVFRDLNTQGEELSSDYALQVAAYKSDAAAIIALLHCGFNVPRSDSHVGSALHVAAIMNHLSAGTLLMENGASITKQTLFEDRSPLHCAVKAGSLQTVQLLLSSGPGARRAHDLLDREGLAPLSIAAAEGHEEMVRTFLKHGLAADVRNRGRTTPLALAAEAGQVKTVQALLEHGEADIDGKDNRGYGPLDLAAINGRAAVARLLLKHGAAVESRDISGRTALYKAAWCGHAETVRVLVVAGGADTNAKDNDGTTPLIRVACSGWVDMVNQLLEHGADINAKCSLGRTALMHSAENKAAVAEVLLQHAAVNVDTQDYQGQTPLSIAAQGGNEAVARMLLGRNDLQPSPSEAVGIRTPMSRAALGRHRRSVRTLLERQEIYGGSDDAAADENGPTAAVRMLLARPEVDVNSMDAMHRTPLMYAAAGNRTATMRVLLARGEMEAFRTDRLGMTGLAHAVAARSTEAAQLLVEHFHTGRDPEECLDVARNLCSWR